MTQSRRTSFDYFVGLRQQHRRDFEADGLGLATPPRQAPR
jgi:hypothetical protein